MKLNLSLSSLEFFVYNHIFTMRLKSGFYWLKEILYRLTGGPNKDSFLPGGNSLSDIGESSQEDCLPFPLDDDLNGQLGSLASSSKKNMYNSSISSATVGAAVLARKNPSLIVSSNKGLLSGVESDTKQPILFIKNKQERPMSTNSFKFPAAVMENKCMNTPSSKELDTYEYIDQDYVFVPATSTELSYASITTSGLGQLPDKLANSPTKPIQKIQAISAPMAIAGPAIDFVGGSGSLGNHSSIRSGTSPGSADDIANQPSDPQRRLQSLMRCAYAISEVANEKLKSEKQLEAFSLQLVCLAIWKQALHVCYNWAATATEGSLSPDIIDSNEFFNRSSITARTSEELNIHGAAAACSQMEREFLTAVERAERLAPRDGNAEMPDAIESIFQEALCLGRRGAVEELMSNVNEAANLYSKSATLFHFLLLEATSLMLNPPFLLNTSDQHRLRRYIDVLTFRQNQCSMNRMSIPHPEGLQSV